MGSQVWAAPLGACAYAWSHLCPEQTVAGRSMLHGAFLLREGYVCGQAEKQGACRLWWDMGAGARRLWGEGERGPKSASPTQVAEV